MNNEWTVVFLKEDQPLITERSEFKASVPYRCNIEKNGALVYGEFFETKEFEDKFELAIDKVKREWEEMEFIVDGKPLTKKAFKERFSIHLYGNQQSGIRAAYVGQPKQLMFQFTSPFRGENNAETLKRGWTNYMRVIDGDYEVLDPIYGSIVRGNSGYPISYGEIYWRPAYQPEKSIL